MRSNVYDNGQLKLCSVILIISSKFVVEIVHTCSISIHIIKGTVLCTSLCGLCKSKNFHYLHYSNLMRVVIQC